MSLSLVFFFISLTAIFLSNIFVITETVKLNFFITVLSPLFLFLLVRLDGKKILIPKKESFFYLFFILFSIISVFLAIDKEIAFQYLLVYSSCYFYFIFSFNYKEQLNKYFYRFLVLISIFSCLMFLIDKIFHLNLFLEGASLFYNYDHNQLGNLLVLGLISIFPNPLFIPFFIFMLFSYSRTAYITVVLIAILMMLKNKIEKKTVILGSIIILISIIFLVLTTKNFYLTKNKQLFGGRNIYFSYSLSSIKERPWFGVGPNNFYHFTLKRQVNFAEATTTAHNIILDILTENGALAGVFFTLFILLMINRHKNNNNFLLLFLATLLIFMFDFSYRYNIFLVLFFVFGGLVVNSNKKIEIDIIFPSLVIFIGAQVIIFGQILLGHGFWKQSLLIYPIQKSAYEMAIEENIRQGNTQQSFDYLQKYDQLFGQSSQGMFNIIRYYKALDMRGEVIKSYKKMLLANPLLLENNESEIINFFIEYYGEKEGREAFANILNNIIKNTSFIKNNDLFRLVDIICHEEKLDCYEAS
ncbi:MAG: O-antigen ligase family protein [Patescibacteria group bacterium]